MYTASSMETTTRPPEPTAAVPVQQPAQPQPQAVVFVPTKDKMVAVLLAVFLGFWAWIYTYHKDAWKFWVNLGVLAALIALILPTFFMSLLFLPFAAFGSWLWALIDVAIKPDEYYSDYFQHKA